MLYRKQYVSGAIVLSLQLLLRAATLVFGYLYTLPVLRGAYAAAGVTASQSTVTQEQSAAVLQALAELPAGQVLLCCLPARMLDDSLQLFWNDNLGDFFLIRLHG